MLNRMLLHKTLQKGPTFRHFEHSRAQHTKISSHFTLQFAVRIVLAHLRARTHAQTVVFKIQDAELRASMRALDEFEAAKRAAAIEAAAADGGGDGSDRPGTQIADCRLQMQMQYIFHGSYSSVS